MQRDDVGPVETLKNRYAAGELSDVEFERRLDGVLDTREQTEESTNGAQAGETTGNTCLGGTEGERKDGSR